jgi:hypothetical protein
MSETADTAPEPDAADADAGQGEGGAERTFTQDQVNSFLADQKRKFTAQFADYDQLRADSDELALIRESEMTELQRALERAEQAEQRASAAEYNSMLSKIAAAKGVPAESLTGSTEEELNTSADALIAWRDEHTTKSAVQKRNPASDGSLRSGATGNGAGTSDPQERAAEALRQFAAREK